MFNNWIFLLWNQWNKSEIHEIKHCGMGVESKRSAVCLRRQQSMKKRNLFIFWVDAAEGREDKQAAHQRPSAGGKGSNHKPTFLSPAAREEKWLVGWCGLLSSFFSLGYARRASAANEFHYGKPKFPFISSLLPHHSLAPAKTEQPYLFFL